MKKFDLKYYPVLFILIALSSCGGYLDTVKKTAIIPIKQGYFDFYPDSNLFTYKSSVVLTRDTEKIYPKSFSVKLPKNLKYYEFVSSSNFAFYYGKGEVIFIKVNLEGKESAEDTAFFPSQEKLQQFIEYELNTANNNKYDIKKIPFDKNRKTLLIRKGNATILLYNIQKGNYDLFYDYVSTFKFI